MKKKYDKILNAIPQAEQLVKQLEPLANSPDSKERMKYLLAKLELASLKNDLANLRVLSTLKKEPLEIEPGFGE